MEVGKLVRDHVNEFHKKQTALHTMYIVLCIIQHTIIFFFSLFQTIIDKYLHPDANDPNTKVFYLKMKGDYHRYLAEIDKKPEVKG